MTGSAVDGTFAAATTAERYPPTMRWRANAMYTSTADGRRLLGPMSCRHLCRLLCTSLVIPHPIDTVDMVFVAIRIF
eukprot:7174225-Pyramimonas_sp.AAC.2